MPSSWVDMLHVLTTYLINNLNFDVAQLNSTKVCELNEGGQLASHRFHVIDHSHNSCSFEILFMQSRNRFRHLPTQSLLCYAYFGFWHFVSSLLLLLALCMLGLGFSWWSTIQTLLFICPVVLTLSMEYVFQRDQLLQESCRISCSYFSSWNSI